MIKTEHAAEALELFEILEAFCLNLPSSYCNDDYYHGLLRSKSGIYESYLAIVKAAIERGNPKVAALFTQYAQEYLEVHPYLKTYEPVVKEFSEKNVVKIEPKIESAEITIEKDAVLEIETPFPEPVEKKITTHIVLEEKHVKLEEYTAIDAENATVDVENVEPELSPKEIKNKYDRIVLEALTLCIKEDFSASYTMFLEAKKLEDCRCFATDFRVDLMLRELSKMVR